MGLPLLLHATYTLIKVKVFGSSSDIIVDGNLCGCATSCCRLVVRVSSLGGLVVVVVVVVVFIAIVVVEIVIITRFSALCCRLYCFY